MDFKGSEIIPGPRAEDQLPHTAQAAVKIVIVGGFGVGKTTMVGSVSEIKPLTTEETMTQAGIGVDDNFGSASKTATTVAMDFGRVTLSAEVVLYLFGTPGQRRFWDLWEGLAEGAVGALVLVDTRRLEDSFEVFDQLETRTGMPFAVAVNGFPGAPRYDSEQLRIALDLLPDTPIVHCDARNKESSANALIKLVEHALRHPASQKALT
jgi:uncharacterized protein